MRREKLYKTPIENILFDCSSDFAIGRMNNLRGSVTSQRINHKNIY
jgi:hypothetical protein